MSRRKRTRQRKPRREQPKKIVVEYDMLDLITNWSTFIHLPRSLGPRRSR